MITKSYAKNGQSCRVTFQFAPEREARSAAVLGEFNDWRPEAHPMERAADGSFRLTVSLPAGRRYRFRYLFDGESWANDEGADSFVLNQFGSQDAILDLSAAGPAGDPVAASPAGAEAKPAGAGPKIKPTAGAARTKAQPEGGAARTKAQPEGGAARTKGKPDGGAAKTKGKPDGGAAKTKARPEGGAARTQAAPSPAKAARVNEAASPGKPAPALRRKGQPAGESDAPSGDAAAPPSRRRRTPAAE